MNDSRFVLPCQEGRSLTRLCLETRTLACLETIVHLNAGGLPFNRYLVEITISNDVWANTQAETASTLPVGWDAEPADLVSIRFGRNWAGSTKSALLVVP